MYSFLSPSLPSLSTSSAAGVTIVVNGLKRARLGFQSKIKTMRNNSFNESFVRIER